MYTLLHMLMYVLLRRGEKFKGTVHSWFVCWVVFLILFFEESVCDLVQVVLHIRKFCVSMNLHGYFPETMGQTSLERFFHMCI